MSGVVDSVLGVARAGATRIQQQASHGHKVVFFHVPKCGGTSVEAALRRALTLRGFGSSRLNPQAAKEAAEALGGNYLDLRESWLVYEVARDRNALISGHVPWSPALKSVRGDYKLMTMVRDPQKQLLSEFFFNRDKTADHFRIDRDTQLKDFLTTPTARDIGSKYVKYFTDPALRRAAWEPEAVEAACRNLTEFDVVGTLEQLDLWVEQVTRLIGRSLDVGHVRPSPTPRSRRDAETDDEALAMVDALCRPNQAVYDRIRQLQAEATGAVRP